METDEKYMWLALDLARQGLGRTSPNPVVGAVIVKNGEILGTGYHQAAGTPHAEIHALQNAGERAEGATLYVTLEPCVHHGKTPPCTDRIIEAGIKKVVISMVDPNPLVSGSGVKALEEAGIKVKISVLEDKARILNEVFIKYITTGLPFVTSKSAMSLDGKIATRRGFSRWITSEKSREYAHQVRNRVDGIMVGIGTVLADDPRLTARVEGEETRDPVRIIVDSYARLPLESRVVRMSGQSSRTILATTDLAPPDKVKALSDLGVEVFKGEVIDKAVDLRGLMKYLGEEGICSILVEGGSTLNYSLVKEGLIDKVLFFVAPKIIGGNGAPTPVGGEGIDFLDDAWQVQDLKVKQLGDDVLLTGYLGKGAD